ncbi:MAG TPA: hypothetical protein VH700_16955 [Gemmatimonadales bacterium]|jgi:hypothetical protein
MPPTNLALLLPLLALAAACASDADTTSPGSPAVVGQWSHGASLQEAARNQTHVHTGYFSFVREGSGFGGEGRQWGYCRAVAGDYTGPLANGVLYAITGGEQDGDEVSFRSDLCEYRGTLSADAQHIEGTARCAYTDGGADFVWTGPWLANRER